MAIPAVMLQDAFPLFPPLGDGPFLDAVEYIGNRHAYGLYVARSKVRELQTLTVSIQHLLTRRLS